MFQNQPGIWFFLLGKMHTIVCIAVLFFLQLVNQLSHDLISCKVIQQKLWHFKLIILDLRTKM